MSHGVALPGIQHCRLTDANETMEFAYNRSNANALSYLIVHG